MALVRLLRSPRFALAVIAFVAAYAAAGAWLPWSLPGGRGPPGWAIWMGLDHPFESPAFLAAVAALFASTLACTWGKRARVLRLQRGELPNSVLRLRGGSGAGVDAFLAAKGFRRVGETWVRQRGGLWGGWVFHVGLLVLMVGVLVQQSLFDTGLFELTEGESLSLRDKRALLFRHRGVLAPAAAPDLEVRLQWFDPFARQEGYAPDRLSQIVLTRPEKEPEAAYLDRSAGARVGGLKFFHAIPTGLSINLEVEGVGRRSIHLRKESDHVAAAQLLDPSGRPARVLVRTARAVDDPQGTGSLFIQFEQAGLRLPLQRGVPFRFGSGNATVLSVGRWAQFTYSRAPGMAGVFAGFVLVLAGSAMLLLQAGIAREVEEEDGVTVLVYVPRGSVALQAEWDRFAAAGGAASTTGRS